MNLSDISKDQLVAYIAGHPGAEPEFGVVSSSNEKNVFVRFLDKIVKLGFPGTTAQACSPGDLHPAIWQPGPPTRIGNYFCYDPVHMNVVLRFWGPRDYAHQIIYNVLGDKIADIECVWWNVDGWTIDFNVISHAALASAHVPQANAA